MRKQLIISFFIFILLVGVTSIIVFFARGYRLGGLGTGKPTLTKNGLLHAVSEPTGAQVYINGNLTTATEGNIDLVPGNYTVKIAKDGYFPWEKKIQITREVVTTVDAALFPLAPKLESITSSGVQNPVMDPTHTKLAFEVASQSARRNGIYILDMNARQILNFPNSPTQIVDDTLDTFSQANVSWSPDGKQLLATVSGALRQPTMYLLDSSGFNDTQQNVTETLATTRDQWLVLKTQKDVAQLHSLRDSLQQVVQRDFKILDISPDETKILYQASSSATLPLIITPRHIGINTMTEDRSIKEGGIYVYDIKDDVNTKLLDSIPVSCDPTSFDNCHEPISWMPDSRHLLYVHDKRISIMELDGQNNTTIYAGPFIDSFVFPWPDGSRVVMLTDFNNTAVQPNLYTIGLK